MLAILDFLPSPFTTKPLPPISIATYYILYGYPSKYQVSKPAMATNTALPTLKELEETARAAIDALKQYTEFGSAKLAIIGGTALWKYIPSGRTTEVWNNLSS